MAAVTCFDVLARKTGMPVPLTKLQELEWHFHAALFSLWMGYGYAINAHPRVDSFTEKLTFGARRGSSWPAACSSRCRTWRSSPTTPWISSRTSYALAEQSESTFGLTHRWIIKGIYAAGIWLVVLGILSVLARVIVFLFGGRSEAEVNLQIGSTKLEV